MRSFCFSSDWDSMGESEEASKASALKQTPPVARALPTKTWPKTPTLPSASHAANASPTNPESRPKRRAQPIRGKESGTIKAPDASTRCRPRTRTPARRATEGCQHRRKPPMSTQRNQARQTRSPRQRRRAHNRTPKEDAKHPTLKGSSPEAAKPKTTSAT